MESFTRYRRGSNMGGNLRRVVRYQTVNQAPAVDPSRWGARSMKEQPVSHLVQLAGDELELPLDFGDAILQVSGMIVPEQENGAQINEPR